MLENNTASDMVKGLHRTKKGGFERTSSNPTGSATVTEGPTCSITFLGIIIDTKALKLRLPGEKLHKLQALLSSWCARKSCTKMELESLLGHLSHAAKVVRPGHNFLRQLFSLLHLTKAPHHFVHLGAGARADLAWWKCFLQSWSGSSFSPLPNPSHTMSIPMPLVPMDVGQLWTHWVFSTGVAVGVGRNRYFGERTCSSSCRCCPVGRIVEREAHLLPLG